MLGSRETLSEACCSSINLGCRVFEAAWLIVLLFAGPLKPADCLPTASASWRWSHLHLCCRVNQTALGVANLWRDRQSHLCRSGESSLWYPKWLAFYAAHWAQLTGTILRTVLCMSWNLDMVEAAFSGRTRFLKQAHPSGFVWNLSVRGTW
jgi:hypothetical protein